jgi:glycosyltransferase 2 family protein
VSEPVVADRPAPRGRARQLLGLTATIAVLAAWGWFLAGQLAQLSAHVWQIAPGWLVAATLLAALYFAGLGGCWAALLRSMQATPGVTIFQGARIWQISMFSRYIPGNIWHVLSRAMLADQVRASRSLVIASATIEQLLTLLGALLVAALALPQIGGAVLGAAGAPMGAVIALALAAGLAAVHPRVLGSILRAIARRSRRPEIAWIYTYQTIAGLLGLYAATSAIAGLGLVAVLFGIGSPSLSDIPFIIGSAALAWAIGYVSIVTPSGLGVREGVLTSLLALIVPLPIAVVASLLFRIASTVGELIALGALWLAGRRAG